MMLDRNNTKKADDDDVELLNDQQRSPASILLDKFESNF